MWNGKIGQGKWVHRSESQKKTGYSVGSFEGNFLAKKLFRSTGRVKGTIKEHWSTRKLSAPFSLLRPKKKQLPGTVRAGTVEEPPRFHLSQEMSSKENCMEPRESWGNNYFNLFSNLLCLITLQLTLVHWTQPEARGSEVWGVQSIEVSLLGHIEGQRNMEKRSKGW